MKKLFLCLLLLHGVAFGVGRRQALVITASGGSPIPASASASDSQSEVKVFTKEVVEICAFNDTAADVYVNVEDGSDASAPSEADAVLEPATGRCFTHRLGAAIFQWVPAGAITSGNVKWDWQYRY